MADPPLADRSAAHLDAPVPPGDPGRLGARLPTPLTSFVGREPEIAAVVDLLRRDGVRLVTLTGPGGVGKTRLAVAIASRLVDPSGDAPCFAALAPVADASLVGPAVARALGVRPSGDRPLPDHLGAVLGARRRLVLLDNLEQAPGAAPVLAEILVACPGLTLLATSREPLHLSGEQEYPVPPLRLPDPGGPADPDALGRSEAVALFAQRARAVRPDFALTAENGPAVAELCRRLDGLPLAVELAAARVKVFSPGALLARLDRRLELLTDGPRDAPPRLRSLRDAVAWSHDLLPTDEQRLFRRLAVFAGGVTPEAAEAVAQVDPRIAGATHPPVLGGLVSLADKSLLRPEEGGDHEPRFGMLETVREFALERLAASGEEPEVRGRHAAYFLGLAEQAAAHGGPEWRRWLDRLGAELANLRAALAWFAETGDAAGELGLAGALGDFWFLRGRLREGMARLEAALARGGAAPAGLRARAMGCLAYLCGEAGDAERALALADASLAPARTAADAGLLTEVLLGRGVALRLAGRPDQAVAVLEEAFAAGAGLDPPPRCWQRVLGNLGGALVDGGERGRGLALVEEALALSRARGTDNFAALALARLGHAAQVGGDAARAAARYGESLRLSQAAGQATHFDRVLVGLAALAADRGQDEQAARLLGAVEAVQEQTGAASLMWPEERDRAAAAARAALGDRAYAAAAAAGRRLPPREAVGEALALAEGLARDAAPAAPPAAGPMGLTPRQREVLRLVAEGRTDRQIADALSISPHTARTHVGDVLAKLGVKTRAAAAAHAYAHSLA